MRLKLTPGKEYLFSHRRLRTLKARFVRIVRAPASDPQDEYYYECELSDMDPVLRPASLRSSGTVILRPSMVTMVQDVPPNYAPPMVEFAPKIKARRGRPGRRLSSSIRRLLEEIRR